MLYKDEPCTTPQFSCCSCHDEHLCRRFSKQNSHRPTSKTVTCSPSFKLNTRVMLARLRRAVGLFKSPVGGLRSTEGCPKLSKSDMVDLHTLAHKGKLEDVRKFLSKYGAKVNDTNRDGQTPLHIAAARGHVDVCRELIASVASLDHQDKKRRTPLRVAVDANKRHAVRVLCESGASTSVVDAVDGRTPLHVAAKNGFTECAEVLVEHGAAVDDIRDKWGHLPDEDCAMSEIRILIEAARKKRAGARGYAYVHHVPSAPLLEEKSHEELARFDLHHEGHRLTGAGRVSSSVRGVDGTGATSISPSSQARRAAAVGGDRCAACNAAERSRQLTPCHHVVCSACARRARDDVAGDAECPVCRSRVFDDNPLLT